MEGLHREAAQHLQVARAEGGTAYSNGIPVRQVSDMACVAEAGAARAAREDAARRVEADVIELEVPAERAPHAQPRRDVELGVRAAQQARERVLVLQLVGTGHRVWHRLGRRRLLDPVAGGIARRLEWGELHRRLDPVGAVAERAILLRGGVPGGPRKIQAAADAKAAAHVTVQVESDPKSLEVGADLNPFLLG